MNGDVYINTGKKPVISMMIHSINAIVDLSKKSALNDN